MVNVVRHRATLLQAAALLFALLLVSMLIPVAAFANSAEVQKGDAMAEPAEPFSGFELESAPENEEEVEQEAKEEVGLETKEEAGLEAAEETEVSLLGAESTVIVPAGTPPAGSTVLLRETDTYYTTLDDALTAAAAHPGPDTLEVIVDISQSSDIVITSDIVLVAATGGHTITFSSSDGIVVGGGESLTLGGGVSADLLTITSPGNVVGVTDGTLTVREGANLVHTGNNSTVRRQHQKPAAAQVSAAFWCAVWCSQ